MTHFVIKYLRNYLPLSIDEEKEIVSKLQFRKLKKNQLLMSVGDICDKIIFIAKGTVRSFNYDSKGNEVTHHFAFENQPLTDPNSFFEQTPTEFSAETIEETEFYWISYAELQSLLSKFPKFEKVVSSILIAQMPRDVESRRYQREASAKDKYNGLLRTHPEIVSRVPLKFIASFLGITIETLSRVRSKR